MMKIQNEIKKYLEDLGWSDYQIDNVLKHENKEYMDVVLELLTKLSMLQMISLDQMIPMIADGKLFIEQKT